MKHIRVQSRVCQSKCAVNLSCGDGNCSVFVLDTSDNIVVHLQTVICFQLQMIFDCRWAKLWLVSTCVWLFEGNFGYIQFPLSQLQRQWIMRFVFNFLKYFKFFSINNEFWSVDGPTACCSITLQLEVIRSTMFLSWQTLQLRRRGHSFCSRLYNAEQDRSRTQHKIANFNIACGRILLLDSC